MIRVIKEPALSTEREDMRRGRGGCREGKRVQVNSRALEKR